MGTVAAACPGESGRRSSHRPNGRQQGGAADGWASGGGLAFPRLRDHGRQLHGAGAPAPHLSHRSRGSQAFAPRHTDKRGRNALCAQIRAACIPACEDGGV